MDLRCLKGGKEKSSEKKRAIHKVTENDMKSLFLESLAILNGCLKKDKVQRSTVRTYLCGTRARSR